MNSGIAFSGYWYGPKLFVHRVTMTGEPYVWWYESAIKSQPALEAEYGERGSSGSSSRRRTDLDRSVHLVGADVHDAGDLEAAGGIHDDVGAEAVRIDEVVWSGDRAVDVALGREVDDRVVTVHGLFEGGRIADVALHERIPRIVVDVRKRGEVPRVGERVVDGDVVVRLGEHVADVVGADETGAAGDEDLHGRLRYASAKPAGGEARSSPGPGWPGRGCSARARRGPSHRRCRGRPIATPNSSASL